jgi:Flp pilus assembly protein TadB
MPDKKKDLPTPRRRDVQSAKKNPLINPNKKEAKKIQKKKMSEIKELRNKALENGDDRYLPIRDKGQVRRLTRDYIDSHTSIAEFFMFVAIAVIILYFISSSLINNINVASGVVLLMYLVFILMIVESIIRANALNKFLKSKFRPSSIPKGTVWYGISRSFQIRSLRLPKPIVKRGDFPK